MLPVDNLVAETIVRKPHVIRAGMGVRDYFRRAPAHAHFCDGSSKFVGSFCTNFQSLTPNPRSFREACALRMTAHDIHQLVPRPDRLLSAWTLFEVIRRRKLAPEPLLTKEIVLIDPIGKMLHGLAESLEASLTAQQG